jgi:hypothetical protein
MKPSLSIILIWKHVEHIILVYKIFNGEVHSSKQGNYRSNCCEHDDDAIDDLSESNIIAHVKIPDIFVGTQFFPHLSLLDFFPGPLFSISANDSKEEKLVELMANIKDQEAGAEESARHQVSNEKAA